MLFPASLSKMAARVTPSSPTPHNLKLGSGYSEPAVVEFTSGHISYLLTVIFAHYFEILRENTICVNDKLCISFILVLKLWKSRISALTQTNLNSRELKGAYINQMTACSKFMCYLTLLLQQNITIKQEKSCFTMKYLGEKKYINCI